MIETVVKYKLMGQEFNDLKKVKEFVENKIGEQVIDVFYKEVPTLSARDKLKMLDAFKNKKFRQDLLKLLQIDFENENYELINILDYGKE
jgi:DNA-directed RNA polymerase subunit F